MSDIELGSVISLIMENPELVAQIKKLAEGKAEESAPASTDTPIENKEDEVAVAQPTSEAINSTPERKANVKGKRSELLHALSPYISEGRQKALETFMTIADILDMMREK